MGRWIIEIPLIPEHYGVFGHGCLPDIVAVALEATGDFFVPTQIECLARNTLFDQPVPLAPGVVRKAPDRLWSVLTDNLIAPETKLAGTITHMHTDFGGVSIEKYGIKKVNENGQAFVACRSAVQGVIPVLSPACESV